MAYITKDEAKIFQRLLNLQGADLLVDGSIGPLTRDAIKAYKDGRMFTVSQDEHDSLKDTLEIKTYGFTKETEYGEESENVKQLQAMLKYQGFGKYLGSAGIDGKFGYGTRKGIEEYVRGRGMNTPAIEKTRYKNITKEIWDIFLMKPYDIEHSIWTDEYMKCNCNGQYCDGTVKPYGVSLGLVMLLLRLEDEVKNEYGSDACIRLTDDAGKSGGIRCEKWNAKSGGVKRSAHIRGLAADVYVSGARNVDYKKVQETGDRINPYGGCSRNYSGNIHIDSRGYRARW